MSQAAIHIDLTSPAPLLRRRVSDLWALVEGEMHMVETRLCEQMDSPIGRIPEVGTHLLGAGGKRLRPLLSVLVGRASEADMEQAVAAGCAAELIHTATLFHDDVVDTGSVRRGRPAARMIYGNGVAVLVGDFCLARGLDLVASTNSIAMVRSLAATVTEMAEGEVAQLEGAGNPDATIATYLRVVDRKTASLMAWCARVGGVLPEGLDLALGRFGRALGRAFQIVDDILDCSTDEGTTGKVGWARFAGRQADLASPTRLRSQSRSARPHSRCLGRARHSRRQGPRHLGYGSRGGRRRARAPACPGVRRRGRRRACGLACFALPGSPGRATPTLRRPGGVMSASASGTDIRGMFDRIAGRYDRANRIMSAGVDVLWRRKAIGKLLAGLGESPRVLDLGAGTLDGAIEMLRRRPMAQVFAADFARNMLVLGRKKPRAAKVRIQVADGHALPYQHQSFDAAFSAFCVRNLRVLDQGLAELRRVVRPGGRIAILEFFRPSRRRPFWDGFYNARVLPLLGRAVTGDEAAYRYLPESIAGFLTRAEFEARLRAAGFAEVQGGDLFPAGVASLVVAE